MSNTSSALLSRQGFPTGYRTSRKEILMFAVLLQDSTYFIMYVYIFVYVFTTYVVTTYILLMKLAVKQIKTIERLTFSSTSPDCSFAFSVVCVTSLTRGDVNNRFIDRAQKVVIYPRLPILTRFSPVVQLQVRTCIWHPKFQTRQIPVNTGVWVVLFQGNRTTAHFCILSCEAAIKNGDPCNLFVQ